MHWLLKVSSYKNMKHSDWRHSLKSAILNIRNDSPTVPYDGTLHTASLHHHPEAIHDIIALRERSAIIMRMLHEYLTSDLEELFQNWTQQDARVWVKPAGSGFKQSLTASPRRYNRLINGPADLRARWCHGLETRWLRLSWHHCFILLRKSLSQLDLLT